MKQCPKCNSQCDDTKIYRPNCGDLLKSITEPIPPTVNKKPKARRVIVLIMLVVSLIGNVLLGIGLYNSSKEADRYYSDYRFMRSDYNEMKDSYDFYDKYTHIVPDDGSGKYHHYGCSELDTSSFWIYNVDLAKTKASPCQKCCADD